MAWLPAWRWLLSLGRQEAPVASCCFGSIHRKEFRLLVYLLDAVEMTQKCPGGHKHVPIQGSFTKNSAIYTDGVADHFAEFFSRALRQRFAEADDGESQGLESVFTNDLLRTGGWRVLRSWFWKKRSHINVLETSVVASLIKQSIVDHFGSRLAILVDPAVAKGALSKGRSSSYALQPVLRRAAACQLAGNLYPCLSLSLSLSCSYKTQRGR